MIVLLTITIICDILSGTGYEALSYILRLILLLFVFLKLRIAHSYIPLLLIFAICSFAIMVLGSMGEMSFELNKLMINLALLMLISSSRNLKFEFSPNFRYQVHLLEMALFSIIVVAKLLGFGERSYSYLEHSGSGLFYAANDTGLVIVIVMFLSYYVSRKGVLGLLFFVLLYLPLVYTLSTKAVLLGFLVVLTLRIWVVFNSSKVYGFSLLVLIVPFVSKGMVMLRNSSYWLILNNIQNYFSSGSEIRAFDYFRWSNVLLVGSNSHDIVESDALDVLLVGGFFTAIIFVVTIVFLLVRSYYIGGIGRLLIVLIVCHSLIAGHVFFSVQVTFMFALTLLTFSRYKYYYV